MGNHTADNFIPSYVVNRSLVTGLKVILIELASHASQAVSESKNYKTNLKKEKRGLTILDQTG